jgi:Predicted transcription factor, homolog of eukaryotic MBF1
MIKNDRQYKITAAQARKFELAISNLHRSDRPADLHPLLWKAQLDALQSQYEELSSDLKEYEVLKSHRPSQINAATLEDLPAALIRARIALDLSQAELARRTGLKEQQIQRYEATNYESATLTRLSEIAKALGVRVAETVFLPQARLDRTSFLDRLSTSGISVDWLTSRLLPPELSTPVDEGEQTVEGTDPSVARSISIVERVFGWDADRLMGVDALKLPREAASLARFKVPAHAEGKKTRCLCRLRSLSGNGYRECQPGFAAKGARLQTSLIPVSNEKNWQKPGSRGRSGLSLGRGRARYSSE